MYRRRRVFDWSLDEKTWKIGVTLRFSCTIHYHTPVLRARTPSPHGRKVTPSFAAVSPRHCHIFLVFFGFQCSRGQSALDSWILYVRSKTLSFSAVGAFVFWIQCTGRTSENTSNLSSRPKRETSSVRLIKG